MAVKIFYSGQLKPDIHREVALDIIKDLAKSLNWENENIVDVDKDLKGVSIIVHPDCEPLTFIFNNKGVLVNLLIYGWNFEYKIEPITNSIAKLCFCITQYSNPETHITIIKFLSFLKQEYFSELNIEDEGGYYPNSDSEELINRMQRANEGIEAIEEILNKTDDLPLTNRKIKNKELEEKIEEILKKTIEKLGPNKKGRKNNLN